VRAREMIGSGYGPQIRMLAIAHPCAAIDHLSHAYTDIQNDRNAINVPHLLQIKISSHIFQ